MTTADAPALLAFHERQPSENLYRRFFSPKPTLTPTELVHFTDIDFNDRVALVLELHGEFVAWASYERWAGRSDADVAFMVDEQHQAKGIATLMLEHLAAIARFNGIERFTAEVLSDNRNMLRVFARAGWPVERHFDSGIAEILFPLTDTEQFIDSVEQREHRADVSATTRLLLPRSIAVIGASDTPRTVGHELWHNTVNSFRGAVYAVNPNHSSIGGQPAFDSLADITDDVSLALIAVPAAQLEATIEQCIAKQVRGAVIYTAVDGTGIDMVAVVAHARRNGLRLVGPASMGIASPRPSSSIEASLTRVPLPVGGLAISLQSGSLGASVLQLAGQLSVGISWFVSLGDKCDVSGNDLLQFWEDDDDTTVIALYTESFGNPRKFARLARRVGRRKPIVAVRTGAAAIGTAGAALYQQAGVVEVPTVLAMLDTARVLATQPVPKGPRVAILTNSRSPGVLATAAVESAGLRAVDPPEPLDWRSTTSDYASAIAAALAADSVDAVLVIHAPPIAAAPAPLDEIHRAANGASKPVLAVLLGRSAGPVLPMSPVPAFSFPEPAADVLGRMYAYGHWLSTEAEAPDEVLCDLDVEAAARLLAAWADTGLDTLTLTQSQQLLAAYAVPTPVAEQVDGNAKAVAKVAERVGYPVAVKAATRRVGRSAQAGVALDLTDRAAVIEVVGVMREALGDDAQVITVQRMAPPGLDVRIECTADARLGPVVTVGPGSLQSGHGTTGASRLAPVTAAGATMLLEQSGIADALGAANLPTAALVDVIRRVAQLAFDHPHIATLTVDPVIVASTGCHVTDVGITLQAVAPDPAMRRLG